MAGGERVNATALLKSGVANSGGWALTVLVNLAATPYMIFKLSVEGYGIYALLAGLVGYYHMLQLGLGQGVVKFVSESRALGDPTSLSRSINATLGINLALGGVGSLALVLLADPIVDAFGVSPEFDASARRGIYACAFGFFFSLGTQTLHAALQGAQRYDLSSAIGALVSTSTTLAIVVCLAAGFGLLEVVYLTAGAAVVGFWIALPAVRRALPEWRLGVGFDRPFLARFFDFSGFLFLSSLANAFQSHLVRYVVAALIGPEAVTYYVVPQKLIRAVGGFSSSAFHAVFPAASELGAVGDLERVRRLYLVASRYFACFALPPLLMLAVFAKPILAVWIDAEFAARSWVVFTLLAFAGLGSITTVPNLIVIGLGHTRLIFAFAAATVASYALFVPALTYWLGVEGAALGMLGSMAPGLVLLVYETRVVIGWSWRSYARQALSFHTAPVLICIAFTVLVAPHLEYSPWLLAASVAGAAMAYGGFMVGLGWVSPRELLTGVGVPDRAIPGDPETERCDPTS